MTAKAVAEAFYARLSGSATSRKQLLDANQATKLACTLNRPIQPGIQVDTQPDIGTPLPPGWHLKEALGQDGSDKSFNPERPFTRRMWAGGRLKWPNRDGPGLRIGDTVTERTRLIKADPKRNRAGKEMIVAGVEKTFTNSQGADLLTDQREWVFLPELDIQNKQARSAHPQEVKADAASSPRKYETSSKVIAQSKHNQTAISLFRFSALTFNAHQIHYSQPWVRDVEGHRDIVVHAPLNLVLMLELFRKAHGATQTPSNFEYRALSPIYADEDYNIKLAESGEVWVEKEHQQALCMTGKFS